MWDKYNLNPSIRVLLVEDAPFLRYAFGRLLRLHGFEVREATDGRAALECLETFDPQLIVTDMMMPVMDGIELIERLRSNPKTASLPILAITADASEQSESRARKAGAADFLPKPVDMPTLLDRLRTLNHC